jgi:uncharacterized protein
VIKVMSFSRRDFLKVAGSVALGAGATSFGGAAYSAYVETGWLAVERIRIPVKGLPGSFDGFKIVVMSDFHLYPYTTVEQIQAAVTLANSLGPDLVALVGDFVFRKVESIFELAPLLAGLDAWHGIFAVLGNHDLWTQASLVTSALENEGILVLRNSGMTIVQGGQRMYLAGSDDAWSGYPDLKATLADKPEDAPAVLLMHEPDLADTVALDGRVALQLSGHSHGGQVRIPVIGLLVLPYLGEKYHSGLYQIDHMWLYTTRGIGVIQPPVRFNCRPEVTEVTLVLA